MSVLVVVRLGQGLLLNNPVLLVEEMVLGEALVEVELRKGMGVLSHCL